MNIIGIILLCIHVICCVGVILVVLLQAGKGAALGAAFGGGASQTVFGAGSASFITKMTWVMAGAFMTTSLMLTLISPWGGGSEAPGIAVMQEGPITAPPLGTPVEAPLGATGGFEGGDLSGGIGGDLTPSEIPAPVEDSGHADHADHAPSDSQPEGQ